VEKTRNGLRSTFKRGSVVLNAIRQSGVNTSGLNVKRASVMPAEAILGSFYFRHTAQDFLREKKKSHQSGKLTVREVSRNDHLWFEVIYTTEADLGTPSRERRTDRLVLDEAASGGAVLRPASTGSTRSVGRPTMGGASAREWDAADEDRRGAGRRRRNGRLGEDEE
jgi:hypothetical protein